MGWIVAYTADNEPYYVNEETGHVQWERPADFEGDETEEYSGDWCWVQHKEHAFVPCKVIQIMGNDKVRVEDQNGDSWVVNNYELGEEIRSMSSLKRLPNDLVQMDDVNDGMIVYTLKQRYMQDRIYTSIGDILVSVNPFKMLPLYTPLVMANYLHNKDPRDLSPHCYGIAAMAYNALMDDRKNQAILISGESGAGKTEATKVCLSYLSEVAGSVSGVEQKILAANPILEAFGNAKTLRNNNSSRFGKFMELYFDDRGKIISCGTQNYLLEKSRVVMQADNERNFHIFYQLCKGFENDIKVGSGTHSNRRGCSNNRKTKLQSRRRSLLDSNLTKSVSGKTDDNIVHTLKTLGLNSANQFQYINQSGCLEVSSIDDAMEFEQTQGAMDNLNIDPNECMDMYKICAIVLHLGNILFEDDNINGAEGSKISSDQRSQESLKWASDLLGISDETLSLSLRERLLTIRGETSHIQLDSHQAHDSRDALSKSLYNKNFDYIVDRVNKAMAGDTKKSLDSSIIGILDIFGFEIFEHNSFEQLCINFANEKLQQHFNRHTFKTEEETYQQENIPFDSVPYIDNQEVLDLIEQKPSGIFPLLDDELKVPRATDISFLDKLNHQNNKLDRYASPPGEDGRFCFSIIHYAGEVKYNVYGFLDKNKDRLYDDLQNMLSTCNNKFISKVLFKVDDNNNINNISSPSSSSSKKGGSRRLTQGAKFKKQLNNLMNTLNTSQPHYIRCIKPNSEKVPNKFDGYSSYNQLLCSGVFEAVTIRKKGYPFRLKHANFWRKFRPLVDDIIKPYPIPNNFQNACNDLINALATKPGLDEVKNCQIGRTMVFWRSKQDRPLSALWHLLAEKMVFRIQHKVRSYLCKILIKQLKEIKPLLIAASKVPNDPSSLPQVENILERSNKLRYQIKEHYLVEEKRTIILETIEVQEKLKVMVNMTIDDIDDDFEDIVKKARKLGINNNLAQKVFEMYKKVEAKREAINALRNACYADDVSREELESALSLANSLKGQYGANFCKNEEDEANQLLKKVYEEEKMCNDILSTIINIPLISMNSPNETEQLKNYVDIGNNIAPHCMMAARLSIQIGDIILDLRREYLTAKLDCLNGLANEKNKPPSMDPMGGIFYNDIWNKTFSYIDEAIDMIESIELPKNNSEISNLLIETNNIVNDEIKNIKKTINDYREIYNEIANVLSSKMSDKDTLLNNINKLELFHNEHDNLFMMELSILNDAYEHIIKEEELINQLYNLLRESELNGTAEEPDITNFNYLNNLQEYYNINNTFEFRIKDNQKYYKLGELKLKLRNILKYAIELSRLPIQERDFVKSKEAWDEVENILIYIDDYQNILKWDIEKIEIELTKELILQQSVIQDVKDRLILAIKERNIESLKYGLEQAEKLALLSHPDEEIRNVVIEAQDLYDKVSLLKKAIDNAKNGSNTGIIDLKNAIEKTKEANLLIPELEEAEELLDTIRYLSRKAHAAWQEVDRQVMLDIIKECDEINVKSNDVEFLRNLIGKDEKSFLQNALKLNSFLGRKKQITDCTVRMKDLFFASSGDSYRLENFPHLRPVDDYARSASILGRFNRNLAENMLKFSADIIPTSLTQLDQEYIKEAIGIFQCILGYMGDRQYSYPVMLAQEIVKIGSQSDILGDEIYVQLIKQLTNNPSINSQQKGFDLLNICLNSIPPGDLLNTYLEFFLRDKRETQLVHQLHNISNDAAAKKQLSLAEIGAVSGKKIYTGWLKIKVRGRLYDSYKKKWFLLEDANLRFFDEEGTVQEARGEIDVTQLSKISARLQDDDFKKAYYSFDLETDDGIVTLASSSSNEREGWIKSIKKAKEVYWEEMMSMSIRRR